VGELGNLKDHRTNCGCLPRKCQNDQCEELLPKNEMEEHIKTCIYSMVTCKYQIYGCEIKLPRQEVAKHEQVHYNIEKLIEENEGNQMQLENFFKFLILIAAVTTSVSNFLSISILFMSYFLFHPKRKIFIENSIKLIETIIINLRGS